MKQLSMGANMALSRNAFRMSIGPISAADITVLQTYEGGKVRGDADMCFFNQPQIASGAISMSAGAGSVNIDLDLSRIAPDVQKLVVTIAMEAPGATVSTLAGMGLEAIGECGFDLQLAGRSEAALILAEIYRHNGAWKVKNISQGFNGGLAALVSHFGIEVAAEPAPAPARPAGISLEKKLVRLEKQAPEMVSLVKQAGVSLAKNKVASARAKMALVLDISGSMSALYKSGKVDVLVRRVMAMGYAMDDDGDIDVFLFGKNVHDFGSVTVENYAQTVPNIRKKYGLEGNTLYGAAMERVRNHYAASNPEGLPVFVMFVTDGGTDDKSRTERQLREASAEPIFWKFMAIQDGDSRWARGRFEFLEKLDELSGRKVDNAHAFVLSDPAAPSDAEMFDLMMMEYADWQLAARQAGILRG